MTIGFVDETMGQMAYERPGATDHGGWGDMTTRTLNAYLSQGDYWMSKVGEFPITNMDAVYRRRAIHWLTRNAAELYRLWTVEAYVDGKPAPDLDTMIGWIDARPSNWVKTMPLYAALMEGLPPELIK